jgi:nicotinic acetylcholine receptor, invertebrate
MIFKYFLISFIIFVTFSHFECSIEEEVLIKKLFNGYNKQMRPIKDPNDNLIVTLDLVLLQLINVYEKEQIMKTNVWISLKWTDFRLNWTRNDSKIESIRVPYERIWSPDIVLFNNADGNYESDFKPNVLIYANTPDMNMLWVPPAIYKSSCTIDVTVSYIFKN